jgi:hypothetical protein
MIGLPQFEHVEAVLSVGMAPWCPDAHIPDAMALAVAEQCILFPWRKSILTTTPWTDGSSTGIGTTPAGGSAGTLWWRRSTTSSSFYYASGKPMLNCSAFRRRAGPSELSGSAAASSGRDLRLKAALGGQHREASFVVLAECALVRPPELALGVPTAL